MLCTVICHIKYVLVLLENTIFTKFGISVYANVNLSCGFTLVLEVVTKWKLSSFSFSGQVVIDVGRETPALHLNKPESLSPMWSLIEFGFMILERRMKVWKGFGTEMSETMLDQENHLRWANTNFTSIMKTCVQFIDIMKLNLKCARNSKQVKY